jgi:hypothetical protein
MRVLATTVLLGALFGAGVGCGTKQAVRDKPLADPLLTTKKPVEGIQFGPVSQVPRSGLDDLPVPPPLPDEPRYK